MAVVKLIRQIKVKSQETIKPNTSNITKNILGIDRVERYNSYIRTSLGGVKEESLFNK